MTKLSDLQRILLSTAAARNDGSLFPLPQSVSDLAGTAKAIKGCCQSNANSSPPDAFRARRAGGLARD